MKKKHLLLAGLLTIGMFSSCNKDKEDDTTTPEIQIETPEYYEFSRDGSSTISFSGQTDRLNMGEELLGQLTDFSQSSENLLEMYANQTATGEDANPFADADLNESTKSIKSKVAASADFFSANTTESAEIKATIGSWIEAQVNEVFPNENELAAVGVAGQIADGSSVRYVNTKGLEYNQAVAKSLIGALVVDQISNNYLSPAVLDAGDNRVNNDAAIVEEGKSYTTMEHKWDEAYGYLFGKSTDATNPLMTLGEDSFLNKYLQRVNEDPDFAGMASDIFEAFKYGRAAIVAGDYAVRNEQAEIIKEKLAEVIAIRSIYYLQQAKVAIAANDMGGAFHDLSEGFGFVYSLRFARKSNSTDAYFTRAEVDGFMDQLTTGNGFWDLDASTLDAISDSIANKFDFTVAQAAE